MNAMVMDKRVVNRWLKVTRLIAALGLAASAHAAPPPRHSLRAVTKEIILRGTDTEGNEIALRVPINILLAPTGSGLAQLQQPGSGANINLNQIAGASVSSSLYDSGNTALKVNCIVGCSAAGSFTDNSAFTTGSTSVTNVSGLFNDTATNLTSGNAGAIRATTDRMLFVNIGKINGTVPTLTGSSLNVNCTAGCGAASGFTDNSAFTVGTSTVNVIGAYFTSGADPACTTGNGCRLRADASSNLKVNCVVGCAGGSTTPSDAFANPSTAGLQFDLLAGFNGTTWDRLRVDGSKNLNVNCQVGCAAGSSTPADAFANPTTAGLQMAFPMVWNGATWDRLYGDKTNGAFVNLKTAIPAGSNVIGHVITDTNSVMNVNLWAGGTLGAMANYGTSPGAVLVPGVNAFITNTPTVTANANTNLNTSALQLDATGAKLNLGIASTTSGQTGPLVQGAVTTNAPSYMTAQTDPLSLDTSGLLRVSVKDTPSNTNNLNVNLAASAATVTVNNTQQGTASQNVAQFGGTNVVTGTGASGAGIPRVTVSNDSSILGTKTNNNAAPGATNFGVLPCIANAATQTWTEGDIVNCSVDLSGQQRVRGTHSDNDAAAAADRVATAQGIYQTSYNNGTAGTQGRNSAQSHGTDGLLWVATLPAMRPASYMASTAFAGSSTTDNSRLPGNASNTVLVTKVIVSCTQTTAGNLSLAINKRSTAGSGGTSANMTVVPMDSNYAAGVSVPVSYTGTGPTVGTLVGPIDNYKLGCMATATATPNDIYILNLEKKPIVLRGTAENVTVNFGGAITGGNLDVTFEWIETATITP